MMKRAAIVLLALAIHALCARPAFAQAPASVKSALSFLLINRSVPTGDFERDQIAAAAARDAVVGFLQVELATLPTNSPASGFVYRLDPSIGATVRVSSSFGPFFMERSLTIGPRQAAIGVAFTSSAFDAIDGRNLRDGTLVSIASRFVGDTVPFDAETLTLRLRTQTTTLSGTYGIGARFDVSASVPFVSVNMDGERVDTYRGAATVQATATASASGIGDVLVRGKYNVFRHGASGIAVAGEALLPTGDTESLLGGGETIITPRAIASFEHGWVTVHGSAGYAFGGASDAVDISGAVTIVATPRLTFTGECLARRVASGGRLVDVVEAHPTLSGVETVRLSATTDVTTRAVLAGGVRWNPAGRWLVSANVLHPLTTAGLTSRWVGSVTVDYSFGG
jgi:hypothetical protein